MKPLKQVGESYFLLSQGEKQIEGAAFEEAEQSYRLAMTTALTIPTEEAFDYDGFDAIAHAGISSALIGLGRYNEALASVAEALRYFNRRGDLHSAEGSLWIAVICNKARALESLERKDEAIKYYRMAGEMIAEKKGEIKQRDLLTELIEQGLQRLEGAKPATAKQGYKAWWEFWS